MDEGEQKEIQPDLVALLDVVFQLIMFFMILMRFSALGQVRHDVTLPMAEAALPMDEPVKDWVFINVNSEGKIVGTTIDANTPAGLKEFLNTAYQAFVLQKGEGKVDVVVVLRADENVEYKRVHDILTQCQQAGYRSWQLRVRTTPQARKR